MLQQVSCYMDIRMISWYDSSSRLRTSTINWKDTLASSIEMTAWCSGTLAPLCKAFTDCAEVCCWALTSETIFPKSDEKELLSAGIAAGKAVGVVVSVAPGSRSI